MMHHQMENKLAPVKLSGASGKPWMGLANHIDANGTDCVSG